MLGGISHAAWAFLPTLWLALVVRMLTAPPA